MRLILNVIWLLFGGLWLALGYVLAALICFLVAMTTSFPFRVSSTRPAAAVTGHGFQADSSREQFLHNGR